MMYAEITMPDPPVLVGAVQVICTFVSTDGMDVSGSPTGIEGTVAARIKVTGEKSDQPWTFATR